MITTLKITTIFAAILCVSLIGFVAAFGLRGDPEIEQLVHSPRIIDELKNLVPKAPATEGQISPLVREAHKFALRIDPPPSVILKPHISIPEIFTPRQPATSIEITPPPPPPARFNVIATCRYEDEPARSMVLIDLPAKGEKWFRVGENVEHMVVTEVLDGSVVMSQSGRSPQTIAMKKQQPLARNLLLQEGQQLPAISTGAIAYEQITMPGELPSQPPRGNAVFSPGGPARGAIVAPEAGLPGAPRGAIVAPEAGLTRAPRGAAVNPEAGARQPPTRSLPQPPRNYSLPTRTRTPAARPTLDQQKVALDQNIADLKSLMARPNDHAPNGAAEEQQALTKMLELLERERKTTEQQSKIATGDVKPSRAE